MRLVGVAEDADTETFTVGLAERPDGTGQALLFMCQLDPEPASPRGAETYCLSTDSATTYYGGVRECVLQGDTLRIKLSRAASGELGIGPELAISLELAEGTRDQLREGLRRVLTSGPRRSHPKKLEL